jgi:Ankyrin repeats (3 copies)
MIKYSGPGDRNYLCTLGRIKKFVNAYRLLNASTDGGIEEVRSFLELALGNDIPVDHQDGEGETPLLLVLKNDRMNNKERETVVKLLLDNKADVNRRSCLGETPLHLASKIGDEATAVLLIDNMADIDCKNELGSTPLHCAAESDRKKVVELLLGRGANATIKNQKEKTASDLAGSETKRLLAQPQLVRGPPVKRQAQLVSKEPKPPTSQIAQEVCHAFYAVAKEFFTIDKEEMRSRDDQPLSVYDLLYGKDQLEVMLMKSRSGVTESPCCTWYHLPANNVSCQSCKLVILNILTDTQMDWVKVCLDDLC